MGEHEDLAERQVKAVERQSDNAALVGEAAKQLADRLSTVQAEESARVAADRKRNAWRYFVAAIESGHAGQSPLAEHVARRADAYVEMEESRFGRL